jgi:hypothetical protein
MSEEGDSFWITLTEKFFGLLLVAISIILFYFTFTSTTVLGIFTDFFGFLGVIILLAGAFLIIVKPTE